MKNFFDVYGEELNSKVRLALRVLVAFALAGLIDGLLVVVQTVLLPELELWLGNELYSVLVVGAWAAVQASLMAWSKGLREKGEWYLPF